MNDNNSSALCVRPIANTTRYSYHSYGGTIDINPNVNPYARGNTILPATSKEFLDRNRIDIPGMIKEMDVCYEAFVSRGYEWGGHWTSLKDYQHFEKKPKQFMRLPNADLSIIMLQKNIGLHIWQKLEDTKDGNMSTEAYR